MDLIQMTRELGAAIQQDDLYTGYHVAKKAADSDPQLQDLIGQFNLKKIALSEAVQQEDKDQGKIAQLNQEVREIYGDIMSNPLMLAVNTTRDEMDRVLQFMQQILVQSANGMDPMTVEEEQGGCSSSDCSSCSGCH